MVVVGLPFYENLGVSCAELFTKHRKTNEYGQVHYTLTILACISAVLAPSPYLFYKYGPAIRRSSKYATNASSGAEKSKGGAK